MKKINKIIISLFVILTAVFMNVANINYVQALETTADIWDGDEDTSWYNPSNTQLSYEIQNAKQLAGLAKLVNEGNGFKNVTFTLTTDIDLNNGEWTPIGKGYVDWGDPSTVDLGFEGTFDGGGYKISGLSVTKNSATSNNGYILGGAALFGYLIKGTVKNVIVDGNVNISTIPGGMAHMGNNAGIVGYNAEGLIENCINYATVESYYTGGGIVGYNDGGTITKCINYGTISKTGGAGACTGGIAGYSANSNITLCHNAGIITFTASSGYGYVGGIVGSAESGYPSVIESCYNSGNVSTSWNTPECGGIIGGAYSVDISDCFNFGTITNSVNSSNCGAIAGDTLNTTTVLNSYYLNTSCARGVALAQGTEEIYIKTDQELRDAEILAVLNKNKAVWGVVSDGSYPVFLFTIPANYEKVDFAITSIPTNTSIYTEASVQNLMNAKGAVVRGKMADEQTTVDGYATAIETAIQQLEYKLADYTKVNAAIAKVPSDLSIYTDDSVRNLNNALDAVVTGKAITEQSTVDGYAEAIEKEISNLKRKGNNTEDVEPSKEINTGDTTGLSSLFFLLLASCGILILKYNGNKKRI